MIVITARSESFAGSAMFADTHPPNESSLAPRSARGSVEAASRETNFSDLVNLQDYEV